MNQEIPNIYIQFESDEFPKADGEYDELVNEDTYGKNLALFLEGKLKEKGYDCPFICCEDWGWWVEIKGHPFAMGLCIYSQENDKGDLGKFYVVSGVRLPNVWSWRKFRKVESAEVVNKIMDDVEFILTQSRKCSSLNRGSDFDW